MKTFHNLRQGILCFSIYVAIKANQSCVTGFRLLRNANLGFSSAHHRTRLPPSIGTTMCSDVYPKSVQESSRHEGKLNVLTFVTASSILFNIRPATAASPSTSKPLLSDEFEMTITGAYLGLGLTELEYGDKKNIRVCVQSVKENADESVIQLVKPGMILVAIQGVNVEGQIRSQVIETIKVAPRPMSIVFRNRETFFQNLNSTSSTVSPGGSNLIVETAISPTEVLRVERLERGTGLCLRSASIGDVVEVSYQVRLAATGQGQGQIIAGAQIVAPQGSRPSDENLYFVLSPSSSSSSSGGAALPAGWDASVRGMCVGERRLITLPASLAFGKEGVVLKKAATAGPGPAVTIPADSPLVIDVRLMSLNGVA